MRVKRLLWAGEELGNVRVDDYPDPVCPVKTIIIHCFDFDGSVTIEGTIEEFPTEDDWFEFRKETFSRPNFTESKIQNRIITSHDRIIWMRAKVMSTVQELSGRKIGGRVDRVTVL